MPQTTSPTVQMLWEPCDPDETLADRFGFPDAAAAAAWVTSTVERHWDVRVESCERILMSFKNALVWLRTTGGELLAKWSIATHRFTRLAGVGELLCFLDRAGLPVSAPLVTADGRPQVEVDGVSIGVQRVVDGGLLDVDEPEQVYAAGRVLARLHEKLASYRGPELVRELPAPSQSMAARVSAWAEDAPSRVPVAAREALDRLVAAGPPESLPTQLVHGDFRAANILCDGPRIVAVLDFEEIAVDHRIVDLARAAVLLGTRFHDWGPVTPTVRARFRSGYESVSRLTETEAAWWGPLVLWFSLAMIPPGEDPTGWAAAAEAATGPLTRR